MVAPAFLAMRRTRAAGATMGGYFILWSCLMNGALRHRDDAGEGGHQTGNGNDRKASRQQLGRTAIM